VSFGNLFLTSDSRAYVWLYLMKSKRAVEPVVFSHLKVGEWIATRMPKHMIHTAASIAIFCLIQNSIPVRASAQSPPSPGPLTSTYSFNGL